MLLVDRQAQTPVFSTRQNMKNQKYIKRLKAEGNCGPTLANLPNILFLLGISLEELERTILRRLVKPILSNSVQYYILL